MKHIQKVEHVMLDVDTEPPLAERPRPTLQSNAFASAVAEAERQKHIDALAEAASTAAPNLDG